jgi:hypothetical protein
MVLLNNDVRFIWWHDTDWVLVLLKNLHSVIASVLQNAPHPHRMHLILIYTRIFSKSLGTSMIKIVLFKYFVIFVLNIRFYTTEMDGTIMGLPNNWNGFVYGKWICYDLRPVISWTMYEYLPLSLHQENAWLRMRASVWNFRLQTFKSKYCNRKSIKS